MPHLVREMFRRMEYRGKLLLRIFAHGSDSIIPGFLFLLLLHRRPFGSTLHKVIFPHNFQFLLSTDVHRWHDSSMDSCHSPQQFQDGDHGPTRRNIPLNLRAKRLAWGQHQQMPSACPEGAAQFDHRCPLYLRLARVKAPALDPSAPTSRLAQIRSRRGRRSRPMVVEDHRGILQGRGKKKSSRDTW
jgi:hypothetical protein